MPKITPCLWFDFGKGEQAAEHYCSIFPNSRVLHVERYGDDGGPGGAPAGSVMVVHFELDGTEFVALNGGPNFTFDEAISFQIDCESQEEVDHYWSRLGDGGEEGPCGWLKDRFGVSWQVVPTRLKELLADSDPEKAKRAMDAMLQMRKIDIATIEEAASAGAHA
jgi:predicted 3-demethylubiquinone-9 3-methyltransferase (glyoxalase superfamily)